MSRFITILLILFLAITLFYLEMPENRFDFNYDIVNQLKTGDLALIEGDSYKSDIVKTTDGNKKNYSHIGFIVIDDGVYIVHMSIDTGYIEWVNIEEYLKRCNVSNIDFYRLNNNISCSEIYALLKELNFKKVEFDFSFDHQRADKLYCSELIIVVLNKLGSFIPIDRNKRYIYPSEFTENNISYKIN